MLLSWLLRLVVVLMLLRLLFRFLRGLVRGLAGAPPQQARGKGAQAAVPLVRDPVCGTYVVKTAALSAVADGQSAWFCSEKCRDSWRAAHAGSRIA
jgi:uncharacterized protein